MSLAFLSGSYFPKQLALIISYLVWLVVLSYRKYLANLESPLAIPPGVQFQIWDFSSSTLVFLQIGHTNTMKKLVVVMNSQVTNLLSPNNFPMVVVGNHWGNHFKPTFRLHSILYSHRGLSLYRRNMHIHIWL